MKCLRYKCILLLVILLSSLQAIKIEEIDKYEIKFQSPDIIYPENSIKLIVKTELPARKVYTQIAGQEIIFHKNDTDWTVSYKVPKDITPAQYDIKISVEIPEDELNRSLFEKIRQLLAKLFKIESIKIPEGYVMSKEFYLNIAEIPDYDLEFSSLEFFNDKTNNLIIRSPKPLYKISAEAAGRYLNLIKINENEWQTELYFPKQQEAGLFPVKFFVKEKPGEIYYTKDYLFKIKENKFTVKLAQTDIYKDDIVDLAINCPFPVSKLYFYIDGQEQKVFKKDDLLYFVSLNMTMAGTHQAELYYQENNTERKIKIWQQDLKVKEYLLKVEITPEVVVLGSDLKVMIFTEKEYDQIQAIIGSSNVVSAEKKYKNMWLITYRIPQDSLLGVQSVQLKLYKNGRIIDEYQDNFSVKKITEKEKQESQIIFKGNKTISVRSKSLLGEKEDFEPGVQREETLRLQAYGRQNSINVEANVYSTTEENIEKKENASVHLWTEDWSLFFGNKNASFARSDFTLKNTNIFGVEGSLFWGNKNYFTLIKSTPDGYPKKQQFYGNNSAGPYKLLKYPIVYNSESLEFNGVSLERDKDYKIDYSSGQITLINRIAESSDIIEIIYEYRESLYQRNTTALRYFTEINDKTDLGISYLSQKDSNQNAEGIAVATSINPVEDRIIEADIGYKVDDYSTFIAELAESSHQTDLLGISNNRTTVQATKTEYHHKSDDLEYKVYLSRVPEDFHPIGNPGLLAADTKKGMFDWKPNDNFYLNGSWDNNLFWDTNDRYDDRRNYRWGVNNLIFSAFEYYHREESLLEINSSENIVSERRYLNDLVKLEQDLSLVKLTIGQEKEKDYTPFNNTYLTRSDSTIAGIASQGWGDWEFSLDAKKKKITRIGDPTVSKNATRDEFAFRSTYKPRYEYFVSALYKKIDDSLLGDSEYGQLDYFLAPYSFLKSEGTFSIESLQESFSPTLNAVGRYAGNLGIEYTPLKKLSLGYKYIPNYVKLFKNGKYVDANNIYQSDIKWSPEKEYSIGITKRENDFFNKDRTDIDLERELDQGENDSYSYTFFWTPIKSVSSEFYLVDISGYNQSQQYDVSNNIYYEYRRDKQKEWGNNTKYRLDQFWIIGARYSSIEAESIYTYDVTSNQKTHTKTGGLNAEYYFTKVFSTTFGNDLSEKKDYILEETAYLTSPFLGFIYRGENLRWEYNYKLTRSIDQNSVHLDKHTAELLYDYTEYFHLSIRGEYEKSLEPYYETTDILSKLSIIF